ncbi:hypothetical protein TcasGA2_TC015228 [Tribolium castaneum]|uniref:C2H2-type domain-containing protein n=1 Tax=Tribolium castaneum TaxID=7070 RepID=D6WWU6_TRICA|nr:hypothetical protein TcasGA2_TC015228 [Tribolium castaneum]
MFKCSQCDNKFTRKDALTRHVKKHKVTTNAPSCSFHQFCEICNSHYRGSRLNHLRSLKHKSVISAKINDDDDFVEEYQVAFKSRITSYRLKNSQLDDLEVCNFFERNQDKLITLITRKLREFNQLKINFELFAKYILPSKDIIEIKSFNTKNIIISISTNIKVELEEICGVIKNKMSEFLEKDSGWILMEILFLELNINKFNPLRASTYIPLPKDIAKRRAVINIHNDDNECFKWSVLAHLHSTEVNVNRHRVDAYREFEEELDFTDISFPVKLTDIFKFEALNNISVNVYGTEQRFDHEKGKWVSDIIGPFYLTSKKRDIHVNLLLIVDDERMIKHYCLISNISRLISSQLSKHNHAKFICNGCLLFFSSEQKLVKHRKYACNEVVTTLPTSDLIINKFGKEVPGNELTFQNFDKSLKVPFVFYFDFESILKPLRNDNSADNIRTIVTHLHEPYSFGYYIKCAYNDNLSIYRTYRGKDAPKIFVKWLQDDVNRLYHDHLKHIVPLEMTPLDELVFQISTHCHLCKEPFKTDYGSLNCDRVRNHCHLTGEFLGPAHSICNLNYKIPKYIPVFCHNLTNYDSHLFIKALATEKTIINCIAQTKEKYITFSKKILVDKVMNTTTNTVDNIFITLRFVDSFRFLSFSLDKLSQTLTSNECLTIRKHFPDDNQFNLIRQKGVFPYSYLDCFNKLDDTSLPLIQQFYDNLNKTDISEHDYERAQEVWNLFDCKTLGDYSDIYLKSDVLLLTDIFENFRKVCLKIYELDPAHYLTAPSLGWDAMLKMTGIKFELLTDIDMVHFFRKSIRGGLCQCSKRKAVANNKFLSNHDPSKPTSFIMYLDATNLYGAAMSEYLPYSGFRWEDPNEFNDNLILNLTDNADVGYIFEVDLEYPSELHNLHNDLPFCPEKFIPPSSKTEKLCATLNNKVHYVLHYRNLRQAIQGGLKLINIHRVLSFNQSPWLKTYIDLNTEMRNKSKNALEKDVFKLMNNSVFGKTMESIDKRVNVKLVTSWNNIGRKPGAESLIARPNFKNSSIFTPNFVAIQLENEKVFYNKPLYVGFTILDISKTIMYDFYYNFIKLKYGNNATLLYTDTDSLVIEIFCENIYDDIKSNIERFDTSNYKAENIHGIPVSSSVIGKMKDEYKGRVISEFLGTGAKAYCVDVEGELSKKAKGIKHNVITSELHKIDYQNAVTVPNTEIIKEMNIFRSKLHNIYTELKKKIALSFKDDKRYILNNSEGRTLSWGHKNILPQTQE